MPRPRAARSLDGLTAETDRQGVVDRQTARHVDEPIPRGEARRGGRHRIPGHGLEIEGSPADLLGRLRVNDVEIVGSRRRDVALGIAGNARLGRCRS